jgi:hypothetical protein
VSILTIHGRMMVPVVMDADHALRLHRVRGQADLISRDGQFYLAVVVDGPAPPPLHPHDWLGVDLGIVNIAADSDGTTYSGGQVNGLRKRHANGCNPRARNRRNACSRHVVARNIGLPRMSTTKWPNGWSRRPKPPGAALPSKT